MLQAKRISLLAGAVSGILGLVVVAGWWMHYLPLIQVFPNAAAPMQRMTALNFLFSGIALILATQGRRRTAVFLQLLVFVTALLVILEYSLGINLGIDELLGPGYVTTHTSHRGRMSPVTAACFIVLSAATFSLWSDSISRRTSALRGIIGSVLAAIGCVSVLVFFVGHTEAYGWGQFTRVAPHTAIGFTISGLGMAALSWQEKRQSGLPGWLPFGATFALGVGVLGLWQALILHEESKFARLSWVLLAGGFGVAILLGLLIYLAQQARERNRELLIYRMAFENSFDGLLLTGLDGSVQTANPSACAMLGRTEEEIRQARRSGVVDTDDPRLQQMLEERSRLGKTRGELNLKCKDGSLFPVELSSVVFKDISGQLRTTIAFRDISERKRAEQQLREQALLLELAHDAIIVRDLQARIVFWNKGAIRTYGWSREEALGCITHELLKTQFPFPLPQIQMMVELSGQWEGELTHTTRAGRKLVVASRWSLMRDEAGRPQSILEINRDITLRKHAESQLRLQTERLSLATRVASIGVWEWDLQTNRSIWDDTCFEMYGVPRGTDVSYDQWARKVHPDDLPQVEESLQRAIRLKSQDYVEFRIVRPDGSLRYVSSAQGVVLDEAGNPIRMVGVNIDVTEQRRMQAQLETSSRLSSLGMMAGGIAHEINNPLTIIHASASDLLDLAQQTDQLPREEVIRNCKRIRETANRIAKIVKSLRRLAREGSQDEFATAQVGKIVEETLEMCRERFRSRSVKLIIPEIDPALKLICREVQIAQVLLNLLQNAFDAVADEPGERWVRLDVAVRDNSLCFSVTDSGPGVPAELKTKIMEPFFTTKDVGKGTGLGLSLSTTIAEEHGGKLELTDEGGHTCFCLMLPIVREKREYAVS